VGTLDPYENYSYCLLVEAENSIGKVGITCVTVNVSVDASGSPSVTSVDVGDPMQDKSKPIVTEVTAINSFLDDYRDAFEGHFLSDSLDTQGWDILKLSGSMGSRFVFGANSNPAVFVLEPDMPSGSVYNRTCADVFAVDNPTTARMQLKGTTQAVVTAVKAVGNGEVIVTHVSTKELACPKTGDAVQMYCFIKTKLPNQPAAKCYIPSTAAVPNPAPTIWDGKSYVHQLHDSPKYQWINDLSSALPAAIAQVPGGANPLYTLSYQWYKVTPVRAPKITGAGTASEAHGGINVAYPGTGIAAVPAGEFNSSVTWNPTLTAVEGARYYYCMATVTDTQNNNVIFTNGTFDPIESPGIEPAKAAKEVAPLLHQVLTGDYSGANRTFWEWARVHIGTPYGIGSGGGKNKLINEDCSGLVISCLYAARPDLRNLVAEVSANNIAHLTNNSGHANQLFQAVGNGVTKNDLIGIALQPGDLICHVRFSEADATHVTHVVIVEEVIKDSNQQISQIKVIEGQGYDDKSTGRTHFTSSAESTVRHDYISEYIDKDATATQKYVQKFYVVRPVAPGP
jgi:hypothetical protein